MPWLLINLINRRIHKSRHKAISIIACTKFARQPSGPHLLFQMDKVKRIPQSLPYSFKSAPTIFATCLPMAGSDRGSVTSHVPTHHSFSRTHSQVFKFTCNTSHSVRLLFFFIKDHLSVSGYGYGYFFCVYFRYKLCLCYFVSQFPPSSFVLLFFFLSENLLWRKSVDFAVLRSSIIVRNLLLCAVCGLCSSIIARY